MADSSIQVVQELIELERLIFEARGLKISDVERDKECSDYLGYNFKCGTQHGKFRKSKITPKKLGQFVTLWKRDAAGQTVPFDIDDDFDFYVVMASTVYQVGFFIFPKEVLARIGVLSAGGRDGKRGFRVYPEWDNPISSQGLITKNRQAAYFNYTIR